MNPSAARGEDNSKVLMKPVLDRWSLSIPRWGQSLAAGLALLACPSSAFACTPVPPLFYALSGVPIIAGESIVSMLAALAVAVAIKSTAFCRLESRVPRRQAALWMVLANVLSTVPGLFICFTGSLWRVEEASVGAVLLGAVVVVRLMLLLKPKWYALLLGIGTMVLFVLVIAVAHSMFYQARR
ncbi:MAG TPA: hypothetical protein DCM86_12090, partial [Verrucomicrobiales bacterium]|nr:hypothetical protein [Verrucomicrobiales bacterium]